MKKSLSPDISKISDKNTREVFANVLDFLKEYEKNSDIKANLKTAIFEGIAPPFSSAQAQPIVTVPGSIFSVSGLTETPTLSLGSVISFKRWIPISNVLNAGIERITDLGLTINGWNGTVVYDAFRIGELIYIRFRWTLSTTYTGNPYITFAAKYGLDGTAPGQPFDSSFSSGQLGFGAIEDVSANLKYQLAFQPINGETGFWIMYQNGTSTETFMSNTAPIAAPASGDIATGTIIYKSNKYSQAANCLGSYYTFANKDNEVRLINPSSEALKYRLIVQYR